MLNSSTLVYTYKMLNKKCIFNLVTIEGNSINMTELDTVNHCHLNRFLRTCRRTEAAYWNATARWKFCKMKPSGLFLDSLSICHLTV